MGTRDRRESWHLAAPFAGKLFGLVPHRFRFLLLSRLAVRLAPLLRRTALYRERSWTLVGPREEALRIAVRVLQRAEVRFPVAVRVETEEPVDALVRGPALCVTGHFAQHPLFIRWLLDAGARPALVHNMNRPVRVAGTSIRLDLISGSSPSLFVSIRRRLRNNGVVILLIDGEAPRRRTAPVEVAGQTRYISRAAFEFAHAVQVPLFFLADSVDQRGEAVVRIERSPSGTPEQMLEAFLSFFRGAVAAIER